jgi:hypothetical protein
MRFSKPVYKAKALAFVGNGRRVKAAQSSSCPSRRVFLVFVPVLRVSNEVDSHLPLLPRTRDDD